MLVDKIVIEKRVLDQFIDQVKHQFPKKAFGYFLSERGDHRITDFMIFKDDIRNDWKDLFEEYGNYYIRNEDAGFLTTPEETFRIERAIRERGLQKIGVFHSHQRHPAIFSKVDVDLHPDESLWHLIISLRNLESPQIKAFQLENKKIHALPIEVIV